MFSPIFWNKVRKQNAGWYKTRRFTLLSFTVAFSSVIIDVLFYRMWRCAREEYSEMNEIKTRSHLCVCERYSVLLASFVGFLLIICYARCWTKVNKREMEKYKEMFFCDGKRLAGGYSQCYWIIRRQGNCAISEFYLYRSEYNSAKNSWHKLLQTLFTS